MKFITAHKDELTEELVDHTDRIELVKGKTNPGKIVFEIERHRAWLSTRYQKGEAMDSLITYWQRYVLDPKTDELQGPAVVRCSRFTVGVAVDLIVEDYDFLVRRGESNHYHVTEEFTGEERDVKNLSEADQLVRELVDGLSFKYEQETLRDALAPDQWPACEARIKRIYNSELKKKLREAWRDRRLSE